MNKRIAQAGLALASALAAASCGGGGSNESAAPLPPAATPSPWPTSADAAARTAQENPLCQAVQPFYWEIGDQTGKAASGSVGGNAPTPTTEMNIASASKWPFAAYVVQKYGTSRGGSSLVPYLNFTSGYSRFDNARCDPRGTVAACNNGGVDTVEALAGTFHYEGGHMQQLAVDLLGLGALDNAGLANEVNGQLGGDVGFGYVAPQPAGGVRTTPARYAVFLRKMMGSTPELALGAMLGDHKVCTQFSFGCNAALDSSVNALPDDFHYGLGHWIEDDADATPSANFAYSSAGAFGFYPWISFDRNWYGIVARQEGNGETNGTGEGYDSLKCGRLIRQAWLTGEARTAR